MVKRSDIQEFREPSVCYCIVLGNRALLQCDSHLKPNDNDIVDCLHRNAYLGIFVNCTFLFECTKILWLQYSLLLIFFIALILV